MRFPPCHRPSGPFPFTSVAAVAALAALCLLLAAAPAWAKKHDVTFRYQPAGSPARVNLAGTFNNWSTDATPMQRQSDGGWTVTLNLLDGEYFYKFVVNGGQWLQDPTNSLGAPDGFGGQNSVLRVGDYERFKVTAHRGDGQILTAALDHEPEMPYWDPLSETEAAVRLRVKRDDVESAWVLLPGGKNVRMRPYAQDGTFDYYRAAIPVEHLGARYAFKVTDGSRSAYLSTADVSEAPPAEDRYFSRTVDPAHIFHTSDWARGAVFYQIFPERFRNGDPSNDPAGVRPWDSEPENDNFMGGDLEGVRQSLPYLKDLGVTAIYFNPIFQSPSNHKYNTTDYLKIDPHFGTNELFARTVKEAHAAGIRVVLDGVFNHSGDTFWAFQDVAHRGAESKYTGWYTFHGFPVVQKPKPNYECWWGYGDLPKLNTNNAGVRKYILGDVVSQWGRMGIDGWRLDVPNEVPHAFWKLFRPAVRAVTPDAWICGEIWDNARPWLEGDEFDAVMNYRFRNALINFFGQRKSTAGGFDTDLGAIRADYPEQATDVMLNLLGSHDTERFLTLASGDRQRLKLAAAFQMTYPGSPCVYYGDEIGLTGNKDPQCRRTFKWDPSQQDVDLKTWYRKWIQLRDAHVSLRRGELETLLAQADGGVYAFARLSPGEKAVVVFNNSDRDAGPELATADLDLPAGTISLAEAFGGPAAQVKDGKLIVAGLPSRSVAVYFTP